jgi:thiamine-phosphate pyrophosphorylase
MLSSGDGSLRLGRDQCLWGVYVILDAMASRLSHIEAARKALAGGARVVQLRDKTARFEELLAIGRELRKMTSDAGATLIVNDNPYLAQEIGADGVHLGQMDFPPYIARELLGPSGIIGLSTHTKLQALAAEAQPVDYIAVGPVFETTSKVSECKPVGVEHVRWVTRNIDIPVVAVGGITAERMPEIIQAGAENIAVIRELMGANDIEQKTRELCGIIAAARLSET